MTMRLHVGRGTAGLVALALGAFGGGCNDDAAPGRTFYQENIQPIFSASCTRNVAGCHEVEPGDQFAFAAGNLDLTSFENVDKRRDTLRTFGAYPVPLMLVKAVGATCELRIPYQDQLLCIDDPHAGGAIFEVGSPAFLTLQQWMANGATENGLPPLAPPESGDGDCTSALPPDFDPAPVLADPTFAQFERDVAPVLVGCNSGTCHGAPQADFFIACGATPDQNAFNFAQARAFVADPVDKSELLQRPLAVAGGGFGHTGGDHFQSSNDEDYRAIAEWAEAVGPIEFGEGDPGKEFFAQHVQPLLLSRGCSFEACHSPQSFNDMKLRSGSQGFFSAISLEKNYDLVKDDFMAMEYADARNSRAVSKNIFARHGGIAHRGGALLETPGGGDSVPSACPAVFDPATASAFCVFQEWVNIERAALIGTGEATPMDTGDTVRMVYVDRAANHTASPLEFDTYQPGSDLMAADLTLGPDGSIAAVGAPTSILASCPGTQGTRDVSGPEVNIDGQTVVFSMRLAAGEPRQIYTVSVEGLGCQQIAPAGFPADVGGQLVHNFDPVWSPDGEYIVFASSRAGTVSRRLFEPQSDLYRMLADGSAPEQITVLTNSEISPAFMREGRITMSTEKVSSGFYQVAGRRINWDLTDYHPLLAQRSQSVFCDADDLTATCPSVDYEQATDIREGADGNFLLVLSDRGARAGAGTLAVFNRSVGPFEAGRSDPGYLQSMRLVDPAATGRVGSATDGAYRSPYSLPGGGILVSYAPVTGDLGSVGSVDFDIVATRVCTPPAPGATCTPQRQVIVGGAGQQVEATLALRRSPHEGYINRRQLVFGGGVDVDATGGADKALLHMIDAPVVFTLLVANLRRGRPVDSLRGATHLAAYLENPAPAGTNAGTGGEDHYENREFLGRVALRSDGSAKLILPAQVPLVFELQDESGSPVLTMTETHQFGPGEVISMGVVAELFDAVCAGCHGSVSGREIDVQVTPDALTGASQSLSLDEAAANPQ